MAKVKICGIQTEEDIRYLNEAGVDFAGFIQFYPKSKRNISTDRAQQLMSGVNPSIQKVAVVVSPTKEQLDELAQAGFDFVQIHGTVTDELLADCPLPVWKAFNVGDLSEFERFQNNDKVTGFVFDAQVPGSGKAFDWNILEKIPATDKLTLLAGGLTPENVSDALRTTKTDGADTSSGVENEQGTGKSRDKIMKFVKAVRNYIFIFLFAGIFVGMPMTVQAHGTTTEDVKKSMLRTTPPASYKIDEDMQRDAKDGEYDRFFLEDEIQTVKIEIDENNLNYLLQNADQKPSVMTNSVNIGGESIGYAGLKTKGSYTLSHTFTDYIGSDRFSFTINFGKYVKKEKYGENQNFYGCKKISFNNFFFDKSMMREFFAMKLMTEMGLPTPQYGLAKLYINDKYYGVYFMVEALDKALVSQNKNVDKKEVSDYITKPENSTLAYDTRLNRFCGEDGSFDLHTVLKKDKNGIYHASGILKDSSYLWEDDEDTLQDVAEMLPTVLSWQKKLNQLSKGKDFNGKKLDVNSEEYLTYLNEVIDVDEVVRYFAVHSFLVQLDNMFVEQHNFGLYIDTEGKGTILPWDYDLSFGCYYPSTAEMTANFDLDMMYKGGDERFGGTTLTAEEIYSQFPLFYVIFQNSTLMEKYHSYLRECSKIATLGGTTSLGKTYEPAWFNSYIETLTPLLEEAGSEELADNVSYLNFTTQPDDLLKALPNLAKIIAMRSVGVLSQTDALNVRVSGEGCDLSTLGNAVQGETSRSGNLAAVDAATGIFVTATYGQGKWNGNSPSLSVETLESKDETFQSILDKVGCEEDELTVYEMSDKATPDGNYRIYIPLASSYQNKEVSFYSYDDEQITELSATADDNLYSADTESIRYIAVVGEEKTEGMQGGMTYLILAALIVIILAGAGILVWRKSSK